MGQRVLADWLSDKYYLDKSGKVHSKEKLFFVLKGEKKEVPDNGLWFQAFTQRNTDLIISVIPTLLHSYCLQLAEDYKDIVKLETAKRTYHRWPWESNSTMHGYMTIVNEDGVFADGEAHVQTVQPSMIPYICTIMNKRAEDRLILRTLGLYQQGFYSQEEFPQDADGDISTYSSNTISKEEIERQKKSKLMQELKGIFDQIRAKDSTFNPEVFSRTILSISDLSIATNENWETVKEGALNKLNSL